MNKSTDIRGKQEVLYVASKHDAYSESESECLFRILNRRFVNLTQRFRKKVEKLKAHILRVETLNQERNEEIAKLHYRVLRKEQAVNRLSRTGGKLREELSAVLIEKKELAKSEKQLKKRVKELEGYVAEKCDELSQEKNTIEELKILIAKYNDTVATTQAIVQNSLELSVRQAETLEKQQAQIKELQKINADLTTVLILSREPT